MSRKPRYTSFLMNQVRAENVPPIPQHALADAAQEMVVEEALNMHDTVVETQSWSYLRKGVDSPGELLGPARSFPTEEEFYEALAGDIDKLLPRDSVYALCGDKDWSKEALVRYLDANVDAAKRGVLVQRIFVEPFSERLGEAIGRQERLAKEIDCFNIVRVSGELAIRVREARDIPDGFGSVVLVRGTSTTHFVHTSDDGQANNEWFGRELVPVERD